MREVDPDGEDFVGGDVGGYFVAADRQGLAFWFFHQVGNARGGCAFGDGEGYGGLLPCPLEDVLVDVVVNFLKVFCGECTGQRFQMELA